MKITHATALLFVLESCLTVQAAITREECTGQGGTVIGDIGNGAIFEPDYLCEDGNPPTDFVVPAPGQPIASEGEVCCGGEGAGLVPPTTTGELPVEGGTTPDVLPTPGSSLLPPISESECEEEGGMIIGDIGDGAILQSGYMCAATGQPPIGSVISRQNDASATPIAVEGSVCCLMEGTNSTIPTDGLPLPPMATRPELSRAECLDEEGTIVGDIGDGSIFEEAYRCESNSLPPIANIVNTEPPIAIEGEVCCGPDVPALPNNQAADQQTEVSRTECVTQGGEVIGDPGDGSTQATGYQCASTGEAPIGTIVVADGEPIPSEGEVCCPVAAGDPDSAFSTRSMLAVLSTACMVVSALAL